MKAMDELVRKTRSALQLAFDRIYVTRHPGLLGRAGLAALRPMVRGISPTDRWSLGVHLPDWLDAANAPPLGPLPKSKRIFIFALYRHQFSHCLVMALLLAWRGHRVTVGYLPKLRSPIKPPLEDHPSAARYLRSVLGPVAAATGGKVTCVDLTGIARGDEPVDEAFVEKQVKNDTVQMLAIETLDPAVPEVARTMAFFRAQGRDAQRTAYRHFTDRAGSYDLALIANGSTFEGAHFCHVAKRLGLPVNTFEKYAFRYVRSMNHGDDFRAFRDFDIAWERRRECGYTEEPFFSYAVARARAMLDERRRASTRSWSWASQGAPDQAPAEALREIGLAADARYVLVCTNVPYDAGYDTLTRIFPSMRGWLVATVRTLLEATDLAVVVRAHPGEAAHYGGRERSEMSLESVGLLSHPRVAMIPGDRPTNTYALMERCHFGSVFSSTTGLELAMLGRAVVLGADVYYGRRGFTVDVDTPEQHAAALADLGRRPQAPDLSAARSADAALLYFILLYVMQWPYPYDKPSSILERPPQRLVRDPQVRRYLATFDALALDRDEWERRAVEFMRADGRTHVPLPDALASAA